MRKILVLGSDFGTLYVVKKAQEMGLYTIVADLMETSPTKQQADEAWNISTTDIDLLEKKCRENDIIAVMFGASDFNISNARELCKRLGLPIYCDNDFSWRISRNKSEFKKICCEVGAPVPQGFFVSDRFVEEELCGIQYPVVVKPSDKSGNRGMSYCNNRKELIQAYKYARTISDDTIIVERRLHGDEYNVHYVLADGEARLLYYSCTHHQQGQQENLYSFKCTTSCHLKQYLEEVDDKAIAVLKRVGCKEGIAWFDMIRDEDGKFYILEMGYRFGGVMTYVPYERVSGFDTIKWMLEISLGKKHSVVDLPQSLNQVYTGCAGSYHLFTVKEGCVRHISGLEEISRLPNVWIDIPKRMGNQVRYNACMGLIGVYAEHISTLCDTLNTINNKLKIENADGENMIIYFNGFDQLKSEYLKGLTQFHSVSEL